MASTLCDDIRGMAESIMNSRDGGGLSLCALLDAGVAVSLTFSASVEGSEAFTSTVRFTAEDEVHVALFNSLKSLVPGVTVQLSRALDAKRDALLTELRSRKNTVAEAREAADARLATAQAEFQAAASAQRAVEEEAREAAAARLATAQAEFQAAASAQRAAEEEVAAIADQEAKAEQLRMFPLKAAPQALQ
jgi:hypothetical protein